MGCFDRWQMVDLHQLVGSGTESAYYHIVLIFFGMFFALISSGSFLGGWSTISVVSLSFLIFSFLCLLFF